MDAARTVREARLRAGLTQAELGRRLGVTQAAVAKLERPGANPKVATLSRALAQCGSALAERSTGPDDALLRAQLALTPAQRIRSLEHQAREGRSMLLAGMAARGHRV